MNILGINLGKTATGHPLSDGGAALLTGEELIVIAEERITRKCHDSGFEKSMLY
ncbi:MAG: hypothetical protein LBS33_04005 [Streptococcaceae bacterium]|nr:hypothetical protein [Streptococcaceae bacterium]